MENWLLIAVGVFLLAMVLYGHHKGFIYMVVTLAALVLSLAVVKVAVPEVTTFLKEKTPVYEKIQNQIERNLGLDEASQSDSEDSEMSGEEEQPSLQRNLIEQLNLPSDLKEALLENNNNEVYQILGVDQFGDYITNYITVFIINIIAYIFTFIAAYIIVRFIFGCVNLIAHLPVLRGMNQLAGALLGGVEGLIIVWVLFLVITAFSSTPVGVKIMTQIEESEMLSFLYQNNLLHTFVLASMKQIL